MDVKIDKKRLLTIAGSFAYAYDLATAITKKDGLHIACPWSEPIPSRTTALLSINLIFHPSPPYPATPAQDASNNDYHEPVGLYPVQGQPK